MDNAITLDNQYLVAAFNKLCLFDDVSNELIQLKDNPFTLPIEQIKISEITRYSTYNQNVVRRQLACPIRVN
jgi:hypothetical protein